MRYISLRTLFDIFQQLGIPMRVHSRFQINLIMANVNYNRDVSQFKNMALPIFWINMVTFVELLESNSILISIYFSGRALRISHPA